MADYSFDGRIPKDAQAYFRAKDLRVGFDHRDVAPAEHAHAFTVAKAAKLDVLDDIRQSLDEALAEGKTFEQFSKELKPRLQKKGWWGVGEQIDPQTGERRAVQLGSPRRLKTIYHSNMRSARAAGQWQRIQRHKDSHPYLVYKLGPSENHRDEHVRWAGTMLPVDHEWWGAHYPPNGYGCKCWVEAVTRPEYERIKQEGIQDPQAAAEVDPDTGLPTGHRQAKRMPVRTEAPPRDMREYTNRRTGEVTRVDRGLHPSWASNPGQDRVRVIREQLMQRLDSQDQQYARASARNVMQSPVLDDWVAQPEGELPAGVVDRDAQKAMGAKSQVVRLSPDSLDKQADSHPDLGVADYRGLPEVLEGGALIKQDARRMVVLRQRDGQWWKAVVKRTGDGERLYVVSYHRADADEVKRERKRGQVIRSQQR